MTLHEKDILGHLRSLFLLIITYKCKSSLLIQILQTREQASNNRLTCHLKASKSSQLEHLGDLQKSLQTWLPNGSQVSLTYF